MIAFKAIATALAVIAVLFLGLSLTKINEASSKNIVFYAMGIYLLCTVAIWI